jgi:hypothetical protein
MGRSWQRLVVSGQWSVVSGQWSVVSQPRHDGCHAQDGQKNDCDSEKYPAAVVGMLGNMLWRTTCPRSSWAMKYLEKRCLHAPKMT